MEKVNILLVDDRVENLEVLEALLGDLNQNLVRAGHGHDALGLGLQQDFAVILVDAETPRIDGLVTAEVIRQREKSRDIPPIIFLTGANNPAEQIIRKYPAAPVDYLTKPVVPEILKSKVMVFIELYRLRQERKQLDSLASAYRDLYKLRQEREQLLEEVRQANHSRDEFLATLSHEMRTPLNSILGWIQVLRKKHVDEVTMARAMEAIERNATAQAEMVKDMLDLSKIITGRLHLDFQLVEFENSAKAALDAVRPAAEAKSIRLEYSLDGTGTRISGDSQRLQQIVWNLLSNSIKFTPPGGCVRVHMERDDPNVRLTVSDTGRGIDPNFLPFLFEGFRQSESARNRRYGGLGLGLSITRHLVELHGGAIAAVSEGHGKGATFTVCLPIREVLPAAVTANAG